MNRTRTLWRASANQVSLLAASCGKFGRLSMVRSVNDGGASGVATVGAAKAEGESERQSPGRRCDAAPKAVADLAARQQARVQSEGLAPRVMPTSPRTGTAPSWRKPFGSGPMSLAQGITKGHSGVSYTSAPDLNTSPGRPQNPIDPAFSYRGAPFSISGRSPEKFGARSVGVSA